MSRASNGEFGLLAPPVEALASTGRDLPSLSVIVTLFQGVEVIGDALRSVLDQTVSPSEIVVCDDGSTDDVDGALRPFSSQITLIRKPNGGVSSALNAAAEAASGDYVVQLDQDDLWDPRRLEAIASALQRRPDLDLVATDASLEIDGTSRGRHAEHHGFPTTREGQRAEIIRHGFFLIPAIRRERLLAVGGYDEAFAIGEDWDCWIRLILTGSLVGLIDAPLYRYRLRPGSASADGARNARANVAVLEKLRRSGLLDPAENPVVDDGIGVHSRRARLLELKQAVDERDARARSLARGIARDDSFPAPTRLKAALASASPRLVRALSTRREGEGGVADGIEHR